MIKEKIKFFFCLEDRAILSFRIYSYIYKNISRPLGYILYQRSKLKYGCDIAPTAKIGKNFKLVHIGGIVIGRNVVIGNNCICNNNVTLGMKNIDNYSMPIIGDNVYLSTGSKLLGDIRIGNQCIIGANSVITKSFADGGYVIAGIPAKILGKI